MYLISEFLLSTILGILQNSIESLYRKSIEY